jgi:NAD(P)-dependent dehydrogenase (short-subunit alcohol dehydrogenase family)
MCYLSRTDAITVRLVTYSCFAVGQGRQQEENMLTRSIRFSNRVAIVTGAGGGLGRCYAIELARRGARVVVNDLGGSLDGTGESVDAAQSVVDEITAAGGEAVASHDSVAEWQGAKRIVQTALDTFGSVDIVVNNAGILRDRTFAKVDLADFEEVVRVHLMGSVYVTKAAFALMRERGFGRIVLTTSASGLYGNFGQTSYGAAKLGVVGLMNCLRLEGERYDIRVNAISPVAATRMTNLLLEQDQAQVLAPEHVTPAVVYLCGDDCPSGHIIAAGAGHFARVEILEAGGISFDHPATAEELSERYSEISDLQNLHRPQSASTRTAELTRT